MAKKIEDFRLQWCLMKLHEKNSDERLVIVWQWIKQNHIDFKQFKVLLDYINDPDPSKLPPWCNGQHD